MIVNGISEAPVNVIIEDPKNANVLYAGNDDGVFFSMNQGANWQSLKLNMPVVPVKDLTIQEREMDLIVATYGRGAYITDISILNQIANAQYENVMLFGVHQIVEDLAQQHVIYAELRCPLH